MIIGVGIDLVKVERIEKALQKWPDAFSIRVFTQGEIDYCISQKNSALSFAGRFAVKEAVMKAFGTGHSGGVKWTDAEVVRCEGGKPSIRLTGRLAELAAETGVREVFISFSHDSGYAVGQAILTGGTKKLEDDI
jgi:holo-[acyl-carrier protein] synthase